MGIKKFQWLFVTAVLALSSCVYDNLDKEDCTTTAERIEFRLNLNVPSSPIATRTAGHESVDGTEAENYIDFKNGDYKILIFDKYGNLNQELGSENCDLTMNAGSSNRYTLVAHLTTEEESTLADLSKFKVMVLANWKSKEKESNPSFEYPEFKKINYSLSEGDNCIYTDKSRNNFPMYKNYGGASFFPSFDSEEYIPMFGVSEEIDLKYALTMSKEGDMSVADIPMLRGMAKVVIVDQTEKGISDPRFSHQFAEGRMIPDLIANPGWNKTEQVTIPSDTETGAEIDAFPEGAALGYNFHYADRNAEGFKTWEFYLTETALKPYKTGSRVSTRIEDVYGWPRPFIVVTHDEKNKSWYLDNNVNVNAGNGEGDESLKSILRNHIYRYTVREQKGQLHFILDVLPWDKTEVPAWNFENAKLVEYLTWKTKYEETDNVDEELIGKDNGYNDKPDELRLIMKPGITDYAEGTFKFEAPVGARWYAELISLNQDHHDAFQFVDADGNPFKDAAGKTLNYATDIIDGVHCQTIRIKNLAEKVFEENNEARLVITIEYPDMTRKEVYVVDPATSGNNYTIVQEITEFV